ncbi:hypothetical protein DWF04_019145 [Cereibacter sphaeroides f. sp. denitrificans]
MSRIRTRLASPMSCLSTMASAFFSSASSGIPGSGRAGCIRLRIAISADSTTTPRRARSPRGASAEISNCHQSSWLYATSFWTKSRIVMAEMATVAMPAIQGGVSVCAKSEAGRSKSGRLRRRKPIRAASITAS